MQRALVQMPGNGLLRRPILRFALLHSPLLLRTRTCFTTTHSSLLLLPTTRSDIPYRSSKQNERSCYRSKKKGHLHISLLRRAKERERDSFILDYYHYHCHQLLTITTILQGFAAGTVSDDDEACHHGGSARGDGGGFRRVQCRRRQRFGGASHSSYCWFARTGATTADNSVQQRLPHRVAPFSNALSKQHRFSTVQTEHCVRDVFQRSVMTGRQRFGQGGNHQEQAATTTTRRLRCHSVLELSDKQRRVPEFVPHHDGSDGVVIVVVDSDDSETDAFCSAVIATCSIHAAPALESSSPSSLLA